VIHEWIHNQATKFAFDGIIRCVIRREGEMVQCQSGKRRYRMLVTRWQKWCEQSRAERAVEGEQR
jgi:hypothetical protein